MVMVKAVWMGLILDEVEDMKDMWRSFKYEGLSMPLILDKWKTLPTPGVADSGNRSDILVEFEDVDVPQLAVHRYHLGFGMNPRFAWIDDYYANNKDIIPPEIIGKHFGGVKNGTGRCSETIETEQEEMDNRQENSGQARDQSE